MSNLENYLKGLSPEIQEKAKACKSAEELLQLADEQDIELNADTLEEISGGCGRSADTESIKYCCPHCGSLEFTGMYDIHGGAALSYTCDKCGAEFQKPLELPSNTGIW